MTSIAVQEASITLIENDDSAFSVLLAETSRAGGRSAEIVLEEVTLFRARGKGWIWDKFPEVSIHPNPEGIWVAQDIRTGRLFREPSVVPYHLIFISLRDYSLRIRNIKEKQPRAVFEYSQEVFGNLPGFKAKGIELIAPPGYAEAGRLVKDADFVTVK